MPLYLDRHSLDGLTSEDVDRAHQQDIAIQGNYGVRFITYWHDPGSGHAFCLVDSPTKDLVAKVHAEAHGAIPSRIVEADLRAVKQFLGRIDDPQEGTTRESAFRTILFTDIEGSTSMTQRLGDARAMEVLSRHDSIVRESLDAWRGTEVKHTGDGIMASFVSAVDAVSGAISMQRKFGAVNATELGADLRVRIGISAGEPVTEDGDLFGATVQLAKRCCDAGEPGCILVAPVIRELCIGKNFAFQNMGAIELKGFDEPINLYRVEWEEPS
jgi:class 3 adenylate cyclase